MSLVWSTDPSDATTISSRFGGIVERERVRSLAAMTAASSLAAMNRQTVARCARLTDWPASERAATTSSGGIADIDVQESAPATLQKTTCCELAARAERAMTTTDVATSTPPSKQHGPTGSHAAAGRVRRGARQRGVDQTPDTLPEATL